MNKKTLYYFRIFLMFVVHFIMTLALISNMPGPLSSYIGSLSKLTIYALPVGMA